MKLMVTIFTLLPLVFAAPTPPLLRIANRQYIDPHRNITIQDQLKDGTPCRDITIIYARGTGQPGNVGATPDPGPPFFQAVADAVGEDKVAIQGVDYPANVIGYLLGGSPLGTVGMTVLSLEARSKCPKTNIILAGYSQGAQVVHNTAVALGGGVLTDISGIVTFGDPYNNRTKGDFPMSRTKVFCNFQSDKICDSSLSLEDGIAGHLIYGQDALKAADFVLEMVGI